jgi:hypothetical protein
LHVVAAPVTCPIKSNTVFVYYTGDSASGLSHSWMVHFLNWWEIEDPSIHHVGLSAAQLAVCNMIDKTKYPSLKMYIELGG